MKSETHVSVDTTDRPVFFPVSDPKYFGIVSAPATASAKTTAVVLLSGTFGGTTTLGRNRFWLKMARSLAQRGHPVMRLDYAGIGDSTGDAVCHELEKPATDELRAAFDLLASQGAEDFIVVGTCYGSRTALVGSAEEPRVRSVHLLVPPIGSGNKGMGGAEHLAEFATAGTLAKKAFSRRVLRRVLNDGRSRAMARRVVSLKLSALFGRSDADQRADDDTAYVSEDFHRPLRQLLERNVPLKMLFGEDDFFRTEFESAREGRLGHLLDAHTDHLDIEVLPGIVRGFLTIQVQDQCIESVLRWVEATDE